VNNQQNTTEKHYLGW